MGRGLNIFNKLVLILNVIFTILLLIACGGPILNIAIFPSLAFLSLGVPILAIVHVLFLGYWLLKSKKLFILSFFTLIIGYFFLDSFVRINLTSESIQENELSIMSFNIQEFLRYSTWYNPAVESEIIEFVKANDPDIVCFQEFDKRGDSKFEFYPFKYLTPWTRSDKSIQAIYSKYPIISNGSLDFPNTFNNAIYVDVLVKKDTLRVYNLHLQSLNVRPGSIKRESPSKLHRRLGNTFIQQRHQADLVEQHSKDINHRKIICGDFNNSQFSNVYYHIKQDMKDTFMEKGFGLGTTYIFKFLPFRIDYILVDPEIEIKSHKNFDVRMSDHSPVMASFRLKE